MIIHKNEISPEIRRNMRGGGGQAVLMHALKKEQYPPHVRLFTPLVLEKDCGIGAHTHEGEAEIFYILQGEGVYNDNGMECIVKASDTAVTYSGETHSIRNERYEPLILLAVIVTE